MRLLTLGTLLLLTYLTTTYATPTTYPETKCDLNWIWVSGGVQLSPAYWKLYREYEATVENTVSSVQVVAWAVTGSAIIQISRNGGPPQTLASAGLSSDILLTSGASTTITVRSKCGTDCDITYTIVIYRKPPSEPGEMKGDPQFTGLHGQSYQIHGVPGEIYNLISDSDIQLNSRFVFLNHGHCPIINGEQANDCWTHPGTYLGELGLKTCSGDKLHIVSGSAHTGFSKVTLNGHPLKIGEMAPLICDHQHSEDARSDDGTVTNGYVSYNSTHGLTIRAGVYSIYVENSDFFVNQEIQVLDWDTIHSHGLIGVSHRPIKHPGAIPEIEGDVDNYLIQERDIWGDTFVFNLFHLDKQ